MSPSPVHQSQSPLKLLVVGGGIAGIMLAILLERKGYNITLVEQSKQWKPIGGGITLTLNGVRILQETGLLSAIEPYVNEIRNINITNQQGKRLSSFNLDEYAVSYAGTLTLLRHDLHNALVGRLSSTNVCLGTSCTAITDEGDKVRVSFTNHQTCDYDLVVGADGINSFVRRSIFCTTSNKYSGYASWRFIVTGVAVPQNTLTEMWGVGKRFGIVPLSGNKVHCFASLNTLENSAANSNISINDFKALFAGFGGYVPKLIDALEDTSKLMYNDLEDVHLEKYHKGRIVLIGDAAHGMTPNMTQGASMAIEDAVVLAAKLTDKSVVERSLEHFQAARSSRTRSVQKKSNLLGKIGQLNNPHLCRLRNYCWQRIPDRWIQNDLKNLLVHNLSF